MPSRVVPNEAGIRQLLAPGGRIAVHLKRKADQCAAHSKEILQEGGHVRSEALINDLKSEGPTPGPSGYAFARFATDVRSKRQDFNYPLALEFGMPEYAPLKPGQSRYGPYAFLRPALLRAGFREKA